MLDNGITVYCDGETRHLELDKQQAERFATYAGAVSQSTAISSRTLTEEEVKIRSRRRENVTAEAGNFKSYLSIISDLEPDELALVLALVDLINYRDSWMLEVVRDLLWEVQFAGPAKANERNPREVLSYVAYDLADWWDTIDTARSHVATHPELFPLPAAPEPAIAPEPAQPATVQPAKTQRARKPRKQATHA